VDFTLACRQRAAQATRVTRARSSVVVLDVADAWKLRRRPAGAHAYDRSSSVQIAQADHTPRVNSPHRAFGVQTCVCACERPKWL
jgi:hypothetical protein